MPDLVADAVANTFGIGVPVRGVESEDIGGENSELWV